MEGPEVQQQYFEEEEPEFEVSEPLKESINHEKDFYCSVVLQQGSKTSPLKYRSSKKPLFDHFIEHSPTLHTPFSKNNRIFSAKPKTKTIQVSTTSSPKKLEKRGRQTTAKINRSTFLIKKQTINDQKFPVFGSQSPKKEQSPNRKTLYWQSWLLDGRKREKCKILKEDTENAPQKLTAQAYSVMSSSGETLLHKNMHQKREIASLTKLMTAFTVMRIVSYYRINIRECKVKIHKQASFMYGTSANLKEDQQLFIIDLLYGLLLPSGNDAGVALAQFFGKFLSFKYAMDNQSLEEVEIGSSIDKFKQHEQYYDLEYQRDSVRLFIFEMNRNCQLIGMKNTFYANPTGLSNSKNLSTAYDLSLLASHCLKNVTISEIIRKKYYSCSVFNERLGSSREVQWKNTNRHLFQIKECIGAKTGITGTAGPCLCSIYRLLGKEIIVIILGCSSVEQRYQDAYRLYRWCRKNMRLY